MGHQIIDAMEPEGALFTPGHTFTTHAIGWGEPQTLSADCSCGQAAIPVEEDYGDSGPSLIPTLVSFVEKYGRDALLHGASVYGNWDTLARQCLGHIEAMGGTLDERISEAMDRLKNASATLQAELAGNFSSGAQGHPVLSASAVGVAARDLEVLTMAQELKDRVPLPKPVPVTAESEAAYEAALEAQYPGWHARIEEDQRKIEGSGQELAEG